MGIHKRKGLIRSILIGVLCTVFCAGAYVVLLNVRGAQTYVELTIGGEVYRDGLLEAMHYTETYQKGSSFYLYPTIVSVERIFGSGRTVTLSFQPEVFDREQRKVSTVTLDREETFDFSLKTEEGYGFWQIYVNTIGLK